ncbi:MAG: adenosine deaminase [Anaerolineae bacterium]|nr:adenosine deaminase [Anaerolineae bacterium]
MAANPAADRLLETLQALPKVDLHRHLEGSLRLSTLAEVARIHGLDLPSYDVEVLRPYVQMTRDEEPDFHTFLRKFNLLRRFYSTREAIERVAYEAVADAASDNVRYLELRFSPVALSDNQGFPMQDVTEWVIGAARRAATAHGIQVRLITTITRDTPPQVAQEVVHLAAHYQTEGIVGVDLAGDEVNYPNPPLERTFRWAKEQGLRITVHAGEATGPDSVREAIHHLGADRIGHGVRAAEDPTVVAMLQERQVPLEMCPTSNLHTGVVKTIGAHPSRRYYQQGIPVTINTDDPSISNITLTDEYLVAVKGIGFTVQELRELILNAARAAFLPAEEKETLWRNLSEELARHLT